MPERCTRQGCDEPVSNDIFEMQLTKQEKVTETKQYPMCERHLNEARAMCIALNLLTGIPTITQEIINA